MRPFGTAPFLGQVRLKLGQEVKYTFTRQEEPADFPMFNPTMTPEEMEHRAAYAPKIKAKKQECDFLDFQADQAQRKYDETPGDADAEFQAYSDAVKAYNNCLHEMDELINIMDFGGPTPTTRQPDFTQTPPPGYEPEPEPEPERPPVATGYQWPAEVPEPTNEPFQPPESPISQTINCGPGGFIDPVTRKCRGSVATGFSMPNLGPAGATGMTTAATSFLGAPLRAVPLYRGRF